MSPWVCGLLLLLGIGLNAQEYPFVAVAGSPRNIEHLLEDRQGRLWMSTHDDVLCFDGVRFLSLRNLGLPPVFSNNLAEDDEGAILTSSEAGVFRYLRGRLEHVAAGMVVQEVIGVAPGVLIASVLDKTSSRGSSLYRMRLVDGTWRSEQLRGLEGGPTLTRDPNGVILSPCSGGWCEFSTRSIVDWRPDRQDAPVFHKSPLEIMRAYRDRMGCLWFRSMEAGAYQCPNQDGPVALAPSIAGRNVWGDVREDRDGSVLFANAASLAVGRPGAFQIATPANGLPAQAITSAVRARDGSIWIGSIGGLYRFPYPFRMTQWKSRLGMFWSFAKITGRIFAGTSAGVARLNSDAAWEALPGSRQFGSISSLLPEKDGGVYAAVSRQGVILLRPDGSLAARTQEGQGGQAEVLARDPEGSVWLGGSGFYKVVRKGSELSLISENPGSVAPPDAFVASDPAGGLWGCGTGNLMVHESAGWRTIVSNGLPRDPCLALAFPPDGAVWTGHRLAFARVHAAPSGAHETRQFSPGDDTGTARGYSLTVDPRHWLWRGSSDGMFVADESQAERGVSMRLNESDGLTDIDVNHGSLFADPDGSMWWSAADSVVHFLPPPDLVHPATLPAVFLSAVSVDGARPAFAETFHDLPNGRNLTIHLGSLDFMGRGSLRVRYRLLPAQRDWHESASLDLNLGNPRWGAHTLEIQSRFSIGAWSPASSLGFVVLRPWWLSWTAILAFAGMSVGGAAGGASWHRKRQARARTNLPDLSTWRLAALAPESLVAGTVLHGRFRVLALVARGGFATIYRGVDRQQANRPCALKVFRRELLDDDWLIHRFQQEVAALDQIDHPSVVSIYSHGIAPGGAPYLAMEFIEGVTLATLLESGPLTPLSAASLLRQTTSALEQIHTHGIYHRDLKPENLMLRAGAPAGKELVLIDFSIAIVKEPDQTIHGLSRAAGTIYYMAPEQAVGFATPASDVYSLAKIVLEMLTGHRLSKLLPHASMDLPDRVRDLVRTLPIPLSVESVEMFGSALEFDPARRPQTPMEFARPILRDLTAGSSGPSTSPAP